MADFFGIDFTTLIFIIVYVIMLPFVILGVIKLLSALMANFRVRKGFIRVDKMLSNDQLTKFWVLPNGGKISFKLKQITGVMDETTMPVRLEKGWVWRDGNIPFIKLDKNNNQIPWEVNRISEDIPKEVIDEMADTAYSAGLLLGANFRGDIKKLQMWLMIIFIMSIIGLAVNYYLTSSIHITTQTVQVISNTTGRIV